MPAYLPVVICSQLAEGFLPASAGYFLCLRHSLQPINCILPISVFLLELSYPISLSNWLRFHCIWLRWGHFWSTPIQSVKRRRHFVSRTDIAEQWRFRFPNNEMYMKASFLFALLAKIKRLSWEYHPLKPSNGFNGFFHLRAMSRSTRGWRDNQTACRADWKNICSYKCQSGKLYQFSDKNKRN